MRLVGDEKIPKVIVEMLRVAGHDVLWVRTNFPGWNDAEILNLAEAERRVLLTLDKDFLQIAIQRKVPLIEGGVVLLRVHPATEENIKPFLDIFALSGREWKGRISVVEAEGIHMVQSR